MIVPTTLPADVAGVVEILATDLDQRGIVLGGSRGESGDLEPGRDWDLLVYVDPGRITGLNLAGRIEGFVFSPTPDMPFVCAEGSVGLPNGDALDVLFVDVALVEQSVLDSRRGSFSLCPMARLISGMPSYVVEAEIALGIECTTNVPEVPANPPAALVDVASSWWHGRASLSLLLASDCLAKNDQLATTSHLLAAAQAFAHVVELRQGWYLPSKSFVSRALRTWPEGDRAILLLGDPPTAQTILAVGDILGLSETAGLAWAGAGRERGVCRWEPGR